MKFRLLTASVFVASLAMPLAAHAQGVPGGVAHGASEGMRIAGPVGGIVGGAVGGVIGGIEGVLGVDQRYRYADYVEPAPRKPYRKYRRSTRKHRHY